MPGCIGGESRARFAGQAHAVAIEQLGRAQAFELAEQRIVALYLADDEASAAQVEYGEAVNTAFGLMHAGDEVVLAFVEQSVVGDRAGCHDAHDLALDRAFAGCRIADLFANGHGLAQAHEAGQILVTGMHRHAGHGDRFAGGLAAGGQCQIEQPRGAARVVVEQLVEITHAVEQQTVGLLGLDAQVLLHHGGVLGGDFGRVGHSRKSIESAWFWASGTSGLRA